MSDPRLYVDAPLSEGARIPLDRDQAHYLVTVMRRGSGGGVRLFNGRDGEWRAVVAAADRKGAALTVGERLREQAAVPDLHLLFAPVKRARTDFIAEKATELGAAAIRPVITRRSIAERVRTDRLQAIAREAAEQTERLCLPQVCEAEPLDRVLDGWDPARRLIFCDEAGDAPPLLEILSGAASGPWAILIGPEGGFDPAERARLRAEAFTVPASLGPRILRADTAAAAALALWQAALGDWRGGG
ncbi:MAG: 16S rRNA (uracil(1498)-N(3))-methyltransferase [Maricaulaceae bacterium]|nr:16S rRNA (uracil(1498)-N(3))-methyltransferase [Maricaulaceae bacterium]